MCCKIATLLFNIIQFVALVCAVLGTAFDQFRPTSAEGFDNTECITLWGTKSKCYGTTYITKTDDLWSMCPARARAFRAAQVCAVLTCALLLVGLIFGIINGCCCGMCCKIFAQIVDGFAMTTAIVAFSIMIDSYLKRRGPEEIPECAAFRDDGLYRIGAGLALMICAAGLALVNIFVGVIPC